MSHQPGLVMHRNLDFKDPIHASWQKLCGVWLHVIRLSSYQVSKVRKPFQLPKFDLN